MLLCVSSADPKQGKGRIHMKNLRIKFSMYGLLIVILQAIPNVIWALWPPSPNALKGNASTVPFIEYGEHILGIAIVILLIFLVSTSQAKGIPKGKWTAVSIISIALYWLCWMLYFAGVQPLPVIYAMVVLPPVAFFGAGISKKVWLISAASALFLVFHLLVALENFPIRI